jgi:hypothetical protein
MATAWDVYLPDVLLEATGCPTPLAIQAVRAAAIDLCQERSVWQETLALIDLVAANPLATIAVPAGSEVATILDVRFYPVGQIVGVPLAGPADEMTLNTLRPGWKDEANTGTVNSPEVCAYPSPLSLRIIPTPIVNQTGAIAVTAALRPTRASADGPDSLYTDYLEAICTGALAKLLAIGNKPWTDIPAAVYKSSLFRRLKARAGIRVLTAGGTMPTTAYPRTLA